MPGKGVFEAQTMLIATAKARAARNAIVPANKADCENDLTS